MREQALRYFTGAKRYNCAQSVYRSLDKHQAIEEEKVRALETAGGGKAPEGLCGALFSAEQNMDCDALRQKTRDFFRQNAGSIACREIRKSRRMSCRDCVAAAAGFLEASLDQARNGKE